MNHPPHAQPAQRLTTRQSSADRSLVKLGGSLLTYEALPTALAAWLQQQPSGCRVFLVGGGPMVDAIRQADARYGLGDAAAHELAIGAMRVTAEMLSAVCSEMRLVPNRRELMDAWGAGTTAIIDPVEMLREMEHDRGSKNRLPRSWQVTSDSIAASLAGWLAIEELVILKSRLPEDPAPEAAAAAGVVDEFFPRAARGVTRVRYVNLRDARFGEVAWHSEPS